MKTKTEQSEIMLVLHSSLNIWTHKTNLNLFKNINSKRCRSLAHALLVSLSSSLFIWHTPACERTTQWTRITAFCSLISWFPGQTLCWPTYRVCVQTKAKWCFQESEWETRRWHKETEFKKPFGGKILLRATCMPAERRRVLIVLQEALYCPSLKMIYFPSSSLLYSPCLYSDLLCFYLLKEFKGLLHEKKSMGRYFNKETKMMSWFWIEEKLFKMQKNWEQKQESEHGLSKSEHQEELWA